VSIVIKDEDIEKIRGIVYKETGIKFESKKDYYVKNRILERISVKNYKSFNEYCFDLMFGTDQNELHSLIEALTINETYFFRDYPQLAGFAEKVLPGYLEFKKQKYDSRIKMWSAACSTGEEPYTLAIIMREMLSNYSEWNIRISATDIDRNALEKAKIGLYFERSLKDVPGEYKGKYFEKIDDKNYKISRDIINDVDFKRLNLVDRLGMRMQKEFDFIFCRNVLIYFNDDSRRCVVTSLYDSLVPGGILFLGHSESVGRITSSFELENIDGFLVYRKPDHTSEIKEQKYA